MRRLSILSVLIAAMLAGCGQVIVFGHVMREGNSSVQPKEEGSGSGGPAPQATAPASAAPAPAPGSAAATPAAPASASGPASTAATASASTLARDASIASVAASSPPPAKSPALAHVVKAVNLTITPEASARVTGDASRFTADALLDAIKSELRSRKLLDEQSANASGTAEIVVDGLATRATTNAIVFGYKMLAGTLEGDIRVTGAGGESTGARIVAESKLTIAASGDDKNPLGPLYRRFAVLAADRLAGVASAPKDPSGIPRY